MKIAVSSVGKNLSDNISDVFGRCEYFLIITIENKKITNTEVMENLSIQKTTGAGISAAQAVAGKDVAAIISNNLGPRAKDVLNQFSIDMYQASGKVEEVIQDFIEGKLNKIT